MILIRVIWYNLIENGNRSSDTELESCKKWGNSITLYARFCIICLERENEIGIGIRNDSRGKVRLVKEIAS